MKKIGTIFCFIFLLTNIVVAQEVHKKLLKGDRSFKKESFADASNHYESVLENEQENVQAIYNLGVTKAKQNNKKEAIELFAKAAELADNQKDRAASFYNAGTLLLTEKDKLDESIALLKKALRNSPKDAAIRKNLAKALGLKRKQEKQKQKQKQDQNQKQNQNQKQDNTDDQKQKQDQDQDQDQKQDQKQDQGKKQKQDPSNEKQNENSKQEQSQQPPNDVKGEQKEEANQQQHEANKAANQQEDGEMNNGKISKEQQVKLDKKNRVLHRLKQIEDAERKVRRKMRKSRGRASNRSGKNW